MKRKKSILQHCTSLLLLLFGGSAAFAGESAATASASCTQVVLSPISIETTSSLSFGLAAPGSGALAVSPDQQENEQNASFRISGEPNRSYSVALPPDGSVEMIKGDGSGPVRRIPVSQFRSVPQGSGVLSEAGADALFVGATRAALSADQEPGFYSGTFTVTVVY